MENNSTSLSQQDREILRSYISIADGIAEFWGDFCELVIHSVENLDHSVIHIINGHYSGRKVGAAISDVTLSFLNRMMAEPDLRNVCYFAKNKRDEHFKALISAITGEDGRIIGLFCMNVYMNTPISTLTKALTPGEYSKQESISETFAENTHELMLDALDSAKKSVYSNLTISSSNKNKEIINILHQMGIFNLKDSVITVADNLGISKNTVYMHIRNISK